MSENNSSSMDSMDSTMGSPPTGSQSGTSMTQSLSDTMNSFSEPTEVNTTNASFLDSNGIIAKIVFLIMVILIFIVLFFLAVKVIGYFTEPSPYPMIIKGQIDGTNQVIVTQSPSNKASIPIMRSNNESTGIEFTWSVWLKINKTGSSGSNITPNWHSPVFIKGDVSLPNNGTNEYCSLNNGPGIYLGKPSDPNHLYILMDSIDTPAISSSNLVIDIPNLPADYFHVAVKCLNTYIDVYINGNLVKRANLMNVPKQNYYDINIGAAGGYSGYLSNLRYYDHALNVFDINNIVMFGPNTANSSLSSDYQSANGDYSYLSTKWYNMK